MAMGPLFEISPELLESLPARATGAGLHCTELPAKHAGGRRLRFRSYLASVEAEVWATESGTQLYVYCAHGLNPLMWWPEVRLVNRLRDLLVGWGANEVNIVDLAKRPNSRDVK